MYLPSSGATIEHEAVLAEQGRVVAAGQFEAGGVQDRDVGIEERVAEAQAFELGRQPLALLELDDEVIDVFVVCTTPLTVTFSGIDLRRGEVVVRLDFLALRAGCRR